MDIGIDLGTTFSVIAVKGQVQLVDGYPEGMYLQECDVTIIPTHLGEMTVPSVLWIDPQNPTCVLVGNEAKQKAKDGECPIMFSKRCIGTDQQLRLHDAALSAKEVAKHILKHLKQLAESALGQPVQRAVVTHPAYFDRNQVEETREAARLAGLDVSLPEQMMMEPAAAALAYIQSEAKDPLRVMTYDLGGGTFDVTILERREGVITIKAFDGDHLLGGYNFDRELLLWLQERLKAAGRVVAYDENDPADRSRRARLLQLMENVKVELSEQRSDKVPVTIKAPDILVDANGNNILILERITREQYAVLIKEHLDKTIACCRRALAKADMEVSELDKILLVGGSTYGKWVQNAVAAAFDLPAELYNPDLCVAAGAALKAAELSPVAAGEGIDVVLDVPPTCSLPTVNVAGRVRVPAASGAGTLGQLSLKVYLALAQGGTLGPAELNDEGYFLFQDLSLLEDEPTVFSVTIADDRGFTRLNQSFTVHYQPDAVPSTPISTCLPKPLYLKTAGGMRLIAEEGAQLPAKCEETFKRLHNDDNVRIEVYQEDVPVGEVYVDRIPAEAGEGCQVVVNVEITKQNEMRGTARVYTRSGAVVAAECPVQIRFPAVQLPDVTELRNMFEELEGHREQLLALSNDAEQRLALSGAGGKVSRKLQKLFDEFEPDRQELQQALRELDRLVNPPPDDMDPPRTQFHRTVADSKDLLASQGVDPQLAPLRTALDRIEREGNEAFTTKNIKKWAAVNESLGKLHARIVKVTTGDGGDGGGGGHELPPTPILKDHFQQETDGLRSALQLKREALESRADYPTKFKARCDEIARAIDQIDINIDKVDEALDPRRAIGQLQIAVRAQKQLEKRIREAGDDV